MRDLPDDFCKLIVQYMFLSVLFIHISPTHAFHPIHINGHVDLECKVCNTSYYCAGGNRNACPPNSLAAVEYADKAEECICKPGYQEQWRGLPLTYDFVGKNAEFGVGGWGEMAGTSTGIQGTPVEPGWQRQKGQWVLYALSVGATTNLNLKDWSFDAGGHPLFAHGASGGRMFFTLPLSRQHSRVRIVYRSITTTAGFLRLFIGGVLVQTCANRRGLSPCSFVQDYFPDNILELQGDNFVMLEQDLQIFLTDPNPTMSCASGLAPSWYLYGQKNSCPSTKGVAAHGSSSAQDCVCLPGFAGHSLSLYTPCSPCPVATYTDMFNTSQCIACPQHSTHSSTKQVNLSACVCKPGFAGTSHEGCIACNASYYCKNGERYTCIPNSLSLLYADKAEDCICKPGYQEVWRGLPLTYDFRGKNAEFGGDWGNMAGSWKNEPGRGQWLLYAFSIGATTNLNFRYPGGNAGGWGVYTSIGHPARIVFSLPLSPLHSHVQVVYRGYANNFLNLFIGGVYKHRCENLQNPPCYFATDYRPGDILEFKGDDYVLLEENLQIFLTHPNPTRSCDPGLAPSWYLYGQKNSCPANKGVLANEASSAEDCVCLPGWYSRSNLSAPCLPCPPGTFADKHNMSQCTPCPENSYHDKTNQTNISACLCNAGWAGFAATGCNECAVNFYAEYGSLICTPCPSGTATYEYPRGSCQCHTGHEPVYQVTNGLTRSYSYPSESNVVILKGLLDNPWGHPHGQVIFSFGWYACDACWCGGGSCAWTVIDLGKIEIAMGVTIQQSHDGSTRGGQVVRQFRVEFSSKPDRDFVFAKSSFDGALDFYPLKYFPTAHVNAFDKVHLLFERPARARYIRITPILSGGGAYFRSGVIIWPDYACSPCALNYLKNYTGTRAILPDKTLTECQRCPSLSYTSVIGSTLCSCNPGAFPDTNSTTTVQCVGCGLGSHLSNGTCRECQDNTFSPVPNAQICQACDEYSFVNTHPRLYCNCKQGTTIEITEINPADNMRTFSHVGFTDQSGWGHARSRLDAFWLTGPGGGFGGWSSGVGGWLTMSLGSGSRVIGVVVQSGGSGYGGGYCYEARGWMTSYSVQYSQHELSGFVSVKNQATQDEMFYTKDIGDTPSCMTQYGCTEFCSARRSLGVFAAPVFANYVKITIRGQHGSMALRAGLLIMANKCVGCPANTFKDYEGLSTSGIGCTPCQLNSVSLPASFDQSQCKCLARFWSNNSKFCERCDPNAQSLPGSTSLSACLCDKGFYDVGNSSCQPCVRNTYKPQAANDNEDILLCTECAPTLVTEFPGNSNESACKCKPGFVFDGVACTICPENTHKAGFNLNSTCNACTPNSFGDSGSPGPLECSCLPGFIPSANVCNLCPPGTYKNQTVHIGNAMIAIAKANVQINLARDCSAGACPATTSAPDAGAPVRNIVDGITNNLFHTSNQAMGHWVMIDMQQTVNVVRVRVYNRQGDNTAFRLDNFEIRVGDSSTFSENPSCGVHGTFHHFRDFVCVRSGRYFSLRNGKFEFLQLAEVEIYGTKPPPDTFECLPCSRNMALNFSGSLGPCQACVAGKTTDGRTGQVECVCDVGTEPDADAVCQTCRAGRFKAMSTDKYTNRECVNCSSCAANQQVATECNHTLDITCKVCQPNSWSLAGRTLIEPCYCNAGYEFVGGACVACPVGKSRQTNNNNSIMCETCGSGTFASVSTTVSCGACTATCDNTCAQVIYDFSKVGLGTPWKDYAQTIGFPSFDMFGWDTGCGGWMGQWNKNAGIQGALPAGYNHLEVTFVSACTGGGHPWSSGKVELSIDGNTKAISYGGTVEYQQSYVAGQWLRIQEFSMEQAGGIGRNLKITLRQSCVRYVKTECDASRDVICQVCTVCAKNFYANNTCGIDYGNDRLDTQCLSCAPGTTTDGRTGQDFCVCDTGLERRHTVGNECVECHAGFFKAASTDKYANPNCLTCGVCTVNQQVSTECNNTHNITCKVCQPNSWSNAGRTLLDPCFCDSGYELVGGLCVACPVGKARQANANNSIRCEVCATGTFTLSSASITCGACQTHCLGNPEQCVKSNKQIYDFKPFQSLDSWKQYATNMGATFFLNYFQLGGVYSHGPGIMNTGWVQFSLPAQFDIVEIYYFASYSGTVWLIIDDVTIKISMNSHVTHKQSYKPGQVLRLEDRDDAVIVNLKITLQKTCDSFVQQECNASRDVICQTCTNCGPGSYANNTCGVNYNNDRLDTQCVLCPAGSYCPGMHISQSALLCPDEGKSPPGSVSEDACDCDPGLFRAIDGCTLCPFDTYCPGKHIQHAIACPPMSRTIEPGSTVRLDCHCARGFYRFPETDEENFNCSLCLPNDFCFNNSAYNCSDELMLSEAGSGFPDNCTCAARFYNNGSRCEDCSVNHYCMHGRQIACPDHEWTNGLTRRQECLCMPGYFRATDENGLAGDRCVPCTNDFFCDGSDDARHICPVNARGRNATSMQECLCDVSYEAIFTANESEPHHCRQCVLDVEGAGSYKGSIGNTPCLPCTMCLPEQHSTWTMIECTLSSNALCDTCTVCHDANTSESARSKYTTSHCHQFYDTECLNCSRCALDKEWQVTPCWEFANATCAPITYERVCPVGFYAGGHTATSDSLCLPCTVRNQQYEGQWLHEFSSVGSEYNNPYSCNISCRPFSRLQNRSDMSYGCTTCETGNVLYKNFAQELSQCSFTCLAGYHFVDLDNDDADADCMLGPAEGNMHTLWNHSLNVTHVHRDTQHNTQGRGAFRVIVSHTTHGHFAVVVGPAEPSCIGRKAVASGPSHLQCCFADLWRVSTKTQLGLTVDATESCSRQGAPWSSRRSDSQLEFEIPDSRLEELSMCEEHMGGLSCVLQVSIVDTVLLHHMSVSLRLEVYRGAALAISGSQQYVPLSGFRAEVQLAYKEADGNSVFLVVSDMVPLSGVGETDVILLSAGLSLVQPPADINCARYVVALKTEDTPASNTSINNWTLHESPVRATTFLRASHDTVFVKLFYTLRLREREETGSDNIKNMMHLAVWRNVSDVHTVCEVPPPAVVVRTGEVLVCNGLGESAVSKATSLLHATETVSGALGGLTSFVARALHAHVLHISVKSMLMAFTLPAAHTTLQGIKVTAMHVGNLDFTDDFRSACNATTACHLRYAYEGPGMHMLRDCGAVGQNTARMWLTSSLGVVHDAGHIAALCILAQRAPAYSHAITLVNTRAYLPRARQWHDLQNHTAPQATTKTFAVFVFD